MHLICPHCRNPIELVEAHPPAEVLCPSCGSSFRLETGATTGPASTNSPRTLGRFQVLDQVGLGAFGTVYKARDPQLDREVALKVPRAGNLASAADRDRFLREGRNLAQLRHPAIVPVHEVGEHDGVPFLVSDFVRGVTLADWLTARRPTPREAAELIATVADALQYAHERGVVHRDVRPSNIMLGENGTPHVMDFGLAKREAGEITMTLDGQVLGTPAYMSPEQARGGSQPRRRALAPLERSAARGAAGERARDGHGRDRLPAGAGRWKGRPPTFCWPSWGRSQTNSGIRTGSCAMPQARSAERYSFVRRSGQRIPAARRGPPPVGRTVVTRWLLPTTLLPETKPCA
jgi:serine/threonine protein kinase